MQLLLKLEKQECVPLMIKEIDFIIPLNPDSYYYISPKNGDIFKFIFFKNPYVYNILSNKKLYYYPLLPKIWCPWNREVIKNIDISYFHSSMPGYRINEFSNDNIIFFLIEEDDKIRSKLKMLL